MRIASPTGDPGAQALLGPVRRPHRVGLHELAQSGDRAARADAHRNLERDRHHVVGRSVAGDDHRRVRQGRGAEQQQEPGREAGVDLLEHASGILAAPQLVDRVRDHGVLHVEARTHQVVEPVGDGAVRQCALNLPERRLRHGGELDRPRVGRSSRRRGAHEDRRPLELVHQEGERGVVRARPGRATGHRRGGDELGDRVVRGLQCHSRVRAPVPRGVERGSHRAGGVGRRLSDELPLPPGPEHQRGQRRDEAGDQPAQEPIRERVVRGGDARREHVGEDDRAHRRREVAPEAAREPGRRRDRDADQRSQDRLIAHQRADDDEHRAHCHQHHVGPAPRARGTTEVREAEEREGAERREQRRDRVVDTVEKEREEHRHHDRDAGRPPERLQSGVVHPA